MRRKFFGRDGGSLRLPFWPLKVSAGIVAGLSIVSLTVPTWPASAHHGGGIEWDRPRVEGPISGTVTEFAFRFPHVHLYLDVENENGEIQEWVMSTAGTPTMLRERGWNRRSVREGDIVTVTYTPHVTSPTLGSIVTIAVNGADLSL